MVSRRPSAPLEHKSPYNPSCDVYHAYTIDEVYGHVRLWQLN